MRTLILALALCSLTVVDSYCQSDRVRGDGNRRKFSFKSESFTPKRVQVRAKSTDFVVRARMSKFLAEKMSLTLGEFSPPPVLKIEVSADFGRIQKDLAVMALQFEFPSINPSSALGLAIADGDREAVDTILGSGGLPRRKGGAK